MHGCTPLQYHARIITPPPSSNLTCGNLLYTMKSYKSFKSKHFELWRLVLKQVNGTQNAGYMCKNSYIRFISSRVTNSIARGAKNSRVGTIVGVTTHLLFIEERTAKILIDDSMQIEAKRNPITCSSFHDVTSDRCTSSLSISRRPLITMIVRNVLNMVVEYHHWRTSCNFCFHGSTRCQSRMICHIYPLIGRGQYCKDQCIWL